MNVLRCVIRIKQDVYAHGLSDGLIDNFRILGIVQGQRLIRHELELDGRGHCLQLPFLSRDYRGVWPLPAVALRG